MRTILERGKLKALLDEVAVKVFHRDQRDTEERPWHVVFSCGCYNEYNTAFCELQGSPVRVSVIIDISEMCRYKQNPRNIVGTVLCLSIAMLQKRRFFVSEGEKGRYASILEETFKLRDKLSKK